MIKTRLTASAIAAAAFGAILMSASAAAAATPVPAAGLIRPEAPMVHARMERRPMMRGGGRGTISTRLGTKTR